MRRRFELFHRVFGYDAVFIIDHLQVRFRDTLNGFAVECLLARDAFGAGGAFPLSEEQRIMPNIGVSCDFRYR
jgi:hypothetical protein